MKGKKTTVALAFLIVILVGVIGFRYSEISGKSPIYTASQKKFSSEKCDKIRRKIKQKIR